MFVTTRLLGHEPRITRVEALLVGVDTTIDPTDLWTSGSVQIFNSVAHFRVSNLLCSHSALQRGRGHGNVVKTSRARREQMGDDLIPDQAQTTSTRWSIAPCFLVDDVVTTANFYRDKLGFHYERFWGDPPAFCMVKRAGIVIMLSQFARTERMRPNRLTDPNGDAWDAYVWVDDVEGLHREFNAKAVTITRDLCDQPYGNRDFDVEDCNGYRLCFGQDVAPQ
jgi:catechol 2,3-dioxygenase-like lactoylglutathione lyase family enzyme